MTAYFNNHYVNKGEEAEIAQHWKAEGLSTRACLGLTRAGIADIDALIRKPKKDIRTIDNIGKRAADEIEDYVVKWLAKNNLAHGQYFAALRSGWATIEDPTAEIERLTAEVDRLYEELSAANFKLMDKRKLRGRKPGP